MNIDKIVSGLASSGVLGGLAGGAVSGALMSNKKARGPRRSNAAVTSRR